MPFIKTEKIKSGIIGFWEIGENDDFTLANSIFQSYHPNCLNYKNEYRKKQILATRLLANQMCPEEKIYQDSSGKPHFKSKEKHLSISNDQDIVVLYISNQPCGIDIQTLKKKISSISHKFLNKNDFAKKDDENELIHLWCAKESMYKIYGTPKILFKNHLTIFKIKENSKLRGVSSQPNFLFNCIINTLKFKNYYLVYTSDFKEL